MIKQGRPITVISGTNSNPDEVDNKLATDLSEDELPVVLAWIRDNLYPSEHVYDGNTSYGLKHFLERATGIYMTNNQFKDAMLLCGFKPEDPDAFNWLFYIDKKSPVFIKDEQAISEELKLCRKFLAESTGTSISQATFARYFNIPTSTYVKWEQGSAEPPRYVFDMIETLVHTWVWNNMSLLSKMFPPVIDQKKG